MSPGPFVPSEWISRNLKYTTSLPRRVRRAATEALQMPAVLRFELSSKNTLQTLTTFKLPTTQSPSIQSPAPDQFFSNEPAPASNPLLLSQLLRLPMPDEQTIHAVFAYARQAWLGGAQSISYAHLSPDNVTTTRFPLGTVTWWKEAALRRIPRSQWVRSRAFVVQQADVGGKHLERDLIVREALSYIARLPWNVHQNISDNKPTHHLWRLLGRNFLSTSQINSKLYLLAEQAFSSAETDCMIRFEPVEVTNYLLEAYANRDNALFKMKDILRSVRDCMQKESVLVLTIANMGNVNGSPHWVPVGVNPAKGEFLFGDSLGEKAPHILEDAWTWLYNHGLARASEIKLITTYLDITRQQDNFNCGLMATNSLENYAFATPLLGSGIRELALHRVQQFIVFADNILTKRNGQEIDIEFDVESEFSTDDEGVEFLSSDGKIVPSATESGACILPNEEVTDTLPVEDGPMLAGSNNLVSPPVAQFPSCNFTFKSSLPSSSDNNGVAPNIPSDIIEQDVGRSDKRRRGDPDGPTPSSSPEKKRVHVVADEAVDLPQLQFPTKASPKGPSHTDDDNFFGDMQSAVSIPTNAKERTSQIPTPSVKSVPRQPAAFRPQSITAFFTKESKEARLERNRRDAEIAAGERSQILAREEQAKHRKAEIQREHARERKAKSRQGQREEKLASGWVPYANRATKRKIELVLFQETNDSSDEPSVAELSRPCRQFKEDERVHKKHCGRKREHQQEEAVRTNWFVPFLWNQVERAAKRTCKPWSPRAIHRELQRSNPDVFGGLSEQTVGRWIDKDARARGESAWSAATLKRVKQRSRPGGENTRTGVLHAYPALTMAINTRLRALRANGVTLTLTTIRAIMISYINVHAPKLFETKQSDGTFFQCSESFARKYLRNILGWSERRATRAAKKVPENVDEILTEAFLREAYIIRDFNIPAELRVNTDQTQVVYHQGNKTTWNEVNAKQVPTIGLDEKRAFTLVPSISASGDVLSMQAIYSGKTDGSCPSPKSPLYAEAEELGIRFVHSKTTTYWSTHGTMHDLVDNIIAPYFDAQKKKLGKKERQYSLWKIDCWSLHKSAEFRTWMQTNHPYIILLFVPGNCTGLWQPLNVGIQRVLKLSIKRSTHRDLVKEISDQLEDDPDCSPKIDNSIKVVRNRSVAWLVNALKDISDSAFVRKAFRLCAVGELNCSQECLTGDTALEMLRELPETNPALHAELIKKKFSREDDALEEPPFEILQDDGLDSDVPLHVAADFNESGELPAGYMLTDDGMIERSGIAEGEDAPEDVDDDQQEAVLELPKVSRSGRTIQPSRWYNGAVWERS